MIYKTFHFKKNINSCFKIILFLLMVILQLNIAICDYLHYFEKITNYKLFYEHIDTDFKKHFSQFKKILILFDLDDTITYSNNNIASGRPSFIDGLKLLLKNSINPIKEASSIWKKNKRNLIQKEIKDIIEFYANQETCFLIGITKGFSGRFGEIENFPEVRIKEIKELGITFKSPIKKNFAIKQKTTLSFWIKKITKGNPYFYEQVLFTDQIEKGSCVEIFIDAMCEKPDCVIVFDDQQENIRSVGQICKKKQIPCFAYLCSIAQNHIQ
jgi:hypothetical protein